MTKQNVRKIFFDEESRIETGAIQFGEDWPGLFVRGDESFFTAIQIRIALKALDKALQTAKEKEEQGSYELGWKSELLIAKNWFTHLERIICEDVIVGGLTFDKRSDPIPELECQQAGAPECGTNCTCQGIKEEEGE